MKKRLYAVLVLAVMASAALSLTPVRGSSAPPCASVHHTYCPGIGSHTECEAVWGEVVECLCTRDGAGSFYWECPY